VSAAPPRGGLTQALAAMKHILIFFLIFLTKNAWACSCGGIESIDKIIASSPTLVEAQVVSFEDVNSSKYGRLIFGAKLRIMKVLKGTVSSREIAVQNLMCYVSLPPELMKPKHVYILPLPSSNDSRYEMAGCAHSGLELINGKLYTFEQAKGIKRRLKFYKTYSAFLRNLSSIGS
jgi:hypothetical protein